MVKKGRDKKTGDPVAIKVRVPAALGASRMVTTKARLVCRLWINRGTQPETTR